MRMIKAQTAFEESFARRGEASFLMECAMRWARLGEWDKVDACCAHLDADDESAMREFVQSVRTHPTSRRAS